MKLVFQAEANPLRRIQGPTPKAYVRPNETLPKGLKIKAHDNAWWNSISNSAALVKEADPNLLNKASTSLKSLLPEDRNMPRIEELITDNKLNGTDLANSILQHTFGNHVRLQSSDRSDPQGLKAFQAAAQIVAAAVEEPLVHNALNVLGSGARGSVTLDIRDIDKFLRKMEPADGARIHAASNASYGLALLQYGTVHDIHYGLKYTKPTTTPSKFTPKNPLERLGVILDHQLHIDSKTIQSESPLGLQAAAYHLTKMAHGPDVAAWVATQFENKFKYGVPVQKGLFAGESGAAAYVADKKSQTGKADHKLVWKK